jgi:molybdopterin molybdotransferase
MLSVKEAFQKVLNTSISLNTEEVSIKNSSQRVLATDIYSTREQPPFDRVAMDGIAINIEKQILAKYKIENIQPAGTPQVTLENIENCVEVMTGATLPKNCNCVIPYETINIQDGYATLINKEHKEYQNIHKQGQDYQKDSMILSKNKIITSPIQAIIASQGNSTVEVYKLPRIFIISTGSELIEPGNEIEKHQIYMSNSYAIETELIAQGFNDTHRIHIIDDYNETLNKIKNCLEQADILILTGGVSAGKFDYVPKVLKELKAVEVFHKIKQKPGKPLWYGTYMNKQIFALPGNPVSCLITLRRYVIESLKYSMGINDSVLSARLGDTVQFNKDFTLFQPVNVSSDNEGSLIAVPVNGNGSGDFYCLGMSSGFLELPEDLLTYDKGAVFNYFPWG